MRLEEINDSRRGFYLNSMLGEITKQARHDVAKHGPMRSLLESHAILKEEYEELWEEIKKEGSESFSLHDLEREAVQVATVALRIAAIARRKTCDDLAQRIINDLKILGEL